jgi:2-keto-4-pentenoate hydratase/2-oxohepta-3-ene-1,7-dioic acid hydratase in catechol pathway
MRIVTYRCQQSGLFLMALAHIQNEQWILPFAEIKRRYGIPIPEYAAQFYDEEVDLCQQLARLRDAILLNNIIVSEPSAQDGWIHLDFGQLGPVVPKPGKIFCIGLNYRKHAQETGMAVPNVPVVFSKFCNAIAASHQPISLPAHSRCYDYEAELVVVIGKRAEHVSEDKALSYVLGYCNGNDLTARELQKQSGQWLMGKTLPNFLPIGPFMQTADELRDPQKLTIQTWRGDQLCQSSNTSDMVFSVAELIAYISRYLPLLPGDIISTGTPEGVLLGRENPQWLCPGETIRVSVESLGVLVSSFIE